MGYFPSGNPKMRGIFGGRQIAAPTVGRGGRFVNRPYGWVGRLGASYVLTINKSYTLSNP